MGGDAYKKLTNSTSLGSLTVELSRDNVLKDANRSFGMVPVFDRQSW